METAVISNSSFNPVKRLYDGYLWTLTVAEPRTQEWLWVTSPAPTLLLVCFYYSMVYFGPRLMRNRPAFRLKWILVVYNLYLTALNFHIAYVLFVNAIKLRYSIFCQAAPPVKTQEELDIANAIWWYWMSKFIEFGDTLFFILRKKDNQLSFLHVYHHSTMPFFWWIGIKWVPGGGSCYCAGMNSIVHVLMYLYYALAALGPGVQKYLWWKRYITISQLIQFTINFVLGIRALIVGCDFTRWIQYFLVVYMASFLVLFGNFYLHAYIKKKQGEAKRIRDDEHEERKKKEAIQPEEEEEEKTTTREGKKNGFIVEPRQRDQVVRKRPNENQQQQQRHHSGGENN